MSTEREQVTAKAAADFIVIAEAVIDGPDEFARTHPGQNWGTWAGIFTDGQAAFIARRLDHHDGQPAPTRLDMTRLLDHERATLPRIIRHTGIPA